MPNIKGPDGRVVSFPDGTSDADIAAAFQGQAGPPSAPPAAAHLGSSLGDTLSTIGNHLAGIVTGPIKAFTQPADPNNPQEVNASAPWSQGGAGKLGLGLYRMTAEPTVNALETAKQQYKAGNIGLNNKPTYDADGNYQSTAASSALDALPVVGPLARSVSNDVEKKGAIAGTAGFATDLLAPGVLAKGAGAVLRGVGTAGEFATTTPAARTLAATRMLTNGNPGELLQSALKPGVKYGADAGAKLQEALPHVLAADPSLQGVSGFARAADAAKDAAAQPYANIMARYRPLSGPVKPGSINGAPVAQAQMGSIPAINLAENPVTGIVNKTGDLAQTYNRNIPFGEADDLRQDANAKLNAFYNKQGGDMNAALSNPETARVKSIGDAIRDSLYPQLESASGLSPGTIPALQQKYGLLSETSDIANKREPVFARHDPISLPQAIVAGHGNPLGMATNFLVQKALRGATDSDALVNSAVDRFQNPKATPLPAGSGMVNQLGNAAASTVGNAGNRLRGISMLRLSGAASPFTNRNNQ